MKRTNRLSESTRKWKTVQNFENESRTVLERDAKWGRWHGNTHATRVYDKDV